MNKSNENQNEIFTKVTLTMNSVYDIHLLSLNESQLRLLEYLDNNHFIDEDVYINYKAEDYKTV